MKNSDGNPLREAAAYVKWIRSFDLVDLDLGTASPVERTRATPVSSHEDSIPRISRLMMAPSV